VTAATPWIVDAHLDLAWNALGWNRDLREPVHVLRVREAADAGPGRGRNTVALPDLRRGGVRLCFATLLARSSGVRRPHVDWDSAEQANASARGHLAYYRALERGGHVTVIDDLAALERHVIRVEAGEVTPLGMVVAMEGADPILAPDDVAAWAADGLRLLGLAHYGPGRYAGGTGTDTGLTDLGRALLPLLPEAGVVLDLTHLSDRAFWQALELVDGPVHVSHGNCRALVPNQRQLDDEQIRAVAARGGVIGVALDAWMLEPGWVKGVSRPDRVNLGHVVDHIEHVVAVTGDVASVGIGSDLDGGFGREQSPGDLNTIADLGRLPGLLALRGFDGAEIEAVMHGNWLAFLRRCWG
jgi:membrane dipeptidase